MVVEKVEAAKEEATVVEGMEEEKTEVAVQEMVE